MRYMGSKSRIAKEILPLILKNRTKDQFLVEPFCGGCNITSHVTGNRIANDNNYYLIQMLLGLTNGNVGIEDITKEVYSSARDDFNSKTNENFNDFEIGWIGWMGSANGRFFDGGYSGISKTKIGTERNYIREAISNLKKQLGSLNGVNFCFGDYRDLKIPEESIIYCDIPYQNTKQYSTSSGFDHMAFWDWCRVQKYFGHKVYVSEYNAPEDFECIWEKSVKSSLSANGIIGGNKVSTERLYKGNITSII